jgi:hypothetical protein
MKASVTKADALLVSQFAADKTNAFFGLNKKFKLYPGIQLMWICLV